MLQFVCNFFSIKSLFFNLFAPLKKLNENDTTDIHDHESNFSIIMGTIAMITLRSLVIILGIFVWCLVLFFGIISFFVWLFLPFILLLAFVLAAASLFKIQNIGDIELSILQSKSTAVILSIDKFKILIS